MNKPVDFEKIIPRPILTQLIRATELRKFSMVFVVSPEAIEQLKSNKVSCLASKEGSCVVLIPQSLIEEHYK